MAGDAPEGGTAGLSQPGGTGGTGQAGGTAGAGQAGGGDTAAGATGMAGTDPGAAGESNMPVGQPVALSFLGMPAASFAGSPLAPLKVAITDANGNTVTTASAEIALALGHNPASATLLGYRSQKTVAGVATFSTIGVDQPGTAYTLLANATTFTEGSSAAFDIKSPPFQRVTTGIYGGPVVNVAVADATTLYATTPTGVWRSTNRASTWTASNFGNPGQAGLIAVDPANPLNLYITPSNGSGSFGGASFSFAGRSDNGGAAWRAIGSNVGSGQIGAFAIDTVNTANLYAGGPGGVFKSIDSGDSWTKTSFKYACYALAVDPIAPTTLYAYGYDQTAQKPAGIFKSVNSGVDWTSINNALLTADLHVYSLFATPTGVFVSAAPAVMFRSVDGGATWADAGISSAELAYAKSNVQRVYAGIGSKVAVSTDGGKTFGAPVDVGSTVSNIAVDLTDENRIYVATDAGVYSSTNGGASFSASSIGISAVSLGAVAVHPTQPNTVLVGGPSSVYRTANGGVTWASTTLAGPVTALAYDPGNASIVYACNLNATLFKSTNGGQTWNAGVDSGGGPYCFDIIVRGTKIFLSTVGGLRKSADGGTTFIATGATSAVYGVDADATGNTLYIASNTGTMKSIDGGATFTPMQAKALGKSIVIDPSDASRIFVGMSCGSAGDVVGTGGVRVSTDAGVTFGDSVGTACVTKLLDLSNGSLLVANGTGFKLSTDHGATYKDGSFGILGEATGISASADGLTVYLSTTLGLYKAANGGQ